VFLPGQPHVERALAQALAAGRLPHALLFTGASGGGRERAARGLASALFCEVGGAPFGCQSCRGCRRAMAGQHPDLHVLMPEAEAVRRGLAEPDGKRKPSADILVDAVRAAAARLRMAAFEGGARVALVVDAHRMNPSAQNALLKTLEEPGDRTLLVLIAPHVRSVLPTIASRCARLAFAPPPAAPVGEAPALWPAFQAPLRARMEAAEAAGKERGDVDEQLALLARAFSASAREAAASGDERGWRDAARWVERTLGARDALRGNGGVQLVLEELLLADAALTALAPRPATAPRGRGRS
jgi:DNA polymerase-3 subunit delta'